MADSVSWKNKVIVTNSKTLSETELAGRMQVRSKMKNECDFFLGGAGLKVTLLFLVL